jgi:uncharacterized damage-inducible protein DinB
VGWYDCRETVESCPVVVPGGFAPRPQLMRSQKSRFKFHLLLAALFGKVPGMLAILQDLVRHKGYANAYLLRAIRQHEQAAQDQELRKLLHHIILADRFWLHLILGHPFAFEEESRLPDSLEAIAGQYRETHVRELEWLSQVREPDLTRMLETPSIPQRSFSIAQAMMQVCMHSHGHRAQCATRLRLLGGTPPAMDFILWLKDRPAPDWA